MPRKSRKRLTQPKGTTIRGYVTSKKKAGRSFYEKPVKTMPSVDQCEIAQVGPVAVLSSTLEIFDKYKADPEDEKSDSEESFHLPMLDDDELENKSIISNGKDKDSLDSQNEETEEDILNKFDTLTSGTPDHFDSKIEDSILNDDILAEGATAKKENGDSSSYESCQSKDDSLEIKNKEEELKDKVQVNNEDNTKVDEGEKGSSDSSRFMLTVTSKYKTISPVLEITAPAVFAKYEESNDSGEFMSIYESENICKQIENFDNDVDECMDVDESVVNKMTESLRDGANSYDETQTLKKSISTEEVKEENINMDTQADEEVFEKKDSTEKMTDVTEITHTDEEMLEKQDSTDDTENTHTDEEMVDKKDSTDEDKCITENNLDQVNLDIENPNECCVDEDVEMKIDTSHNDSITNEKADEALEQAEEKRMDDQPIHTEENEPVELRPFHKDADILNLDKSSSGENSMESTEHTVNEPESKPSEEHSNINGEDSDKHLEKLSANEDVSNLAEETAPETDKGQELEEADDVIMEGIQTVDESSTMKEDKTIELADVSKETATVGNELDDADSCDLEEEPSKKLSYDDQPILIEDDLKDAEHQEDKNERTDILDSSDSNAVTCNENDESSQFGTENNACIPTDNDSDPLEIAAASELKTDQTRLADDSVSETKPLEDTCLKVDLLEPSREAPDSEESSTEVAVPEIKLVDPTNFKADVAEEMPVLDTEPELVKTDNESKLNAKAEPTDSEDPLLKELDETINTTSTTLNVSEVTADKPQNVNNTAATDTETTEDLKVNEQEKPMFEKDACVLSKPEIATNMSDPPDKCEVSNDSSKNHDADEDLLDISIIRDTEEDDACARASALEDNTAMAAASNTDPHSSDKSDNDDEDRSEAAVFDGDNEDSEMDKDDNDDQDHEPMDFDDISNVASCDQDTTTGMSTSDSEAVKSSEDAHKDTYRKDDDIASDETSCDILNKSEVHKTVEANIERADSEIDIGLCDASDKNSENSSESGNLIQSANKTDNKSMTKDVEKSTDLVLAKEDTGKSKGNKRSLSHPDTESELASKKIKLSGPAVITQKTTAPPEPLVPETPSTKPSSPEKDKVKTLNSFELFMQNRKMKRKLTRSDLEQFCIQKICESVMLKSSDGELHQTIKKQEKVIESLRKDIQQLTKQAKDLEIVNKKLMSELRIQNNQVGANKKPLVPLRITRSVGLQVRLNVIGEPTPPVRRRQAGSVTPQKATTPTPANTTTNANTTTGPANKSRLVTHVQNTAVRQVLTSPQKSTTTTPVNTTATIATSNTPTTPILTQALQNRARPTVASKRTTQIRPKIVKTAEAAKTPVATPTKPNNPGVIDLTDEDDRTKPNATQPKILNKTVGAQMLQNKTTILNKPIGGKTTTLIGQKAAPAGAKVGTPTRTVTALPPGVRLTPQQMKGGIAIPVSSSGGTTQLMYVLPTISNAGGTQKVAFVNIQPTNGGVLPSSLAGSAVSVVANKQGGNTLTLKTVSQIRKHPAPLPSPPRVATDPNLKPILPKPHLTIRKTDTGIILQWKMPYNLDSYESIASYQLYAYQETNSPPSTDMWRKVGDVKALALPMACTLTQFADKNKYYFAVRSVDVHKRIGAFSDPEEISL